VSVKQSKRRKPIPAVESHPELPKERWTPIPFLDRYRIALLIALIAIGSVRIVSTYNVFSHTWDEPGHIAAGVELLRNHVYQFDQQHPTLTRMAVGIGPALAGEMPPGQKQPGVVWMFQEARKLLYSSGKYQQILFSARLGILPFFWMACAVAYLWGKRYVSPAAGVFAAFLFSFFPAALAHGGLATTDMACTAMTAAVFLAGCIFVEEPSIGHAIAFGVLGGLAILSKFSVLAFFPASAALAFLWYAAAERPGVRALKGTIKKLAPFAAISAILCGFVIWAGYAFSFANGVPAPEFWSGIREVMRHNVEGHWSFLLGKISAVGFWYFFPVAIAVKTPIAFLLLAGAGAWYAVRDLAGRLWLTLAYAGAILAVGMFSNINIGLRHILPMYVALAVLGGAALVKLFEGRSRRAAAASLLLVWMAATSLLSHPDYLAYVNALAGTHPENVMVDSDLDWGQDLNRLGRRLHELGAHEVAFTTADGTDLALHPGFEGIKVNGGASPTTPAVGWNAVSLTGLKEVRLGLFDTHLEVQLWQDVVPPAERVGNSILLWYFPPR
jgi:4-amino-4-deoxy-L-arabinose transferase-like glycosyltransferase